MKVRCFQILGKQLLIGRCMLSVWCTFSLWSAAELEKLCFYLLCHLYHVVHSYSLPVLFSLWTPLPPPSVASCSSTPLVLFPLTQWICCSLSFSVFVIQYGHNVLLSTQCSCYSNWNQLLLYELSGKDLVMIQKSYAWTFVFFCTLSGFAFCSFNWS